MKSTLRTMLVLLLFSCNSSYDYSPEREFSEGQNSILKQFLLAEDSSVIELPEGHFIFEKSLILEGRRNVIIKGQGPDKTVLSFKAQSQGAEGIRVANCVNVTLRDFAIEDSAGDNIKVTDTNGITFDNVKSGWTGPVDESNGAYGFYPVLSTNVTVRNCEVFGASDAGIYVGQSDTVLIENNNVYWNVAGIESENSKEVVIRNNEAYENTGGILVFDLPGLTQYGQNIEVYGNKVYENNTANFAPPGNMVGIVPPGTGMLVLATTGVDIHDNEIVNNKTIGLGVVSYAIVEALGFEEDAGGGGSRAELEAEHAADANYNPYVGRIEISNNSFENTYMIPNLENDFGKLFLLEFGFDGPDIAWDGLQSPDYFLLDGSINPEYAICITESKDVKTVNLSAGTNFDELEVNPIVFKCEL